jgi:hypothetical protein
MHRTLIATVLAGFLSATAPSSLLDHLWHLVSVFWGDTATTDAGLGWDPDGGDTSTGGGQGDEGRGWDPDGGASPLQNTQAKVGCTFDPSGRCNPQP